MVNSFSAIGQAAIIPDQLTHYVEAVSGMKPELCGNCLLYRLDGYGVLAAWHDGKPLSGDALEQIVETALDSPGLKHLTVISGSVPGNAPQNVTVIQDRWWHLELPVKMPQGKLANLLRRAARDARVETDSGKNSWREEHQKMSEEFCHLRTGSLEEGSKYIFTNLAKYLESSQDVLLFSARDRKGLLQACAIGDFSAFSTAFYMFAFRKPDAVPGVADLLVEHLLAEARNRGMSKVNMGLGINPSIEFFKRKWGATPAAPHIESAWQVRKKGLFSRLFGK